MNKRFRRRLALVAIPAAVAAACFGGAAVSAPNATVTTITVNTLPIANALPLDLGIQKGFFAAQGIEIKKNTLQSGNDIVLSLANNNGDIGYIGYTPAMIGRTQGIPITVVAASETEGTSEADNWQNVVVRGSSSIRTPADLAGKTVALNALKGVAEIVVRGALDKRRRRLGPGQVHRDAVPGHAGRPRKRAGGRHPHARALHVADPRRRWPCRAGTGTGAR